MTDNRDILICLEPDEAAAEQIEKIFPQKKVRFGPWIRESGYNLPSELLKGIEIFLCELPPANFDDFDTLSWIQLTSAGFTQVLDLPILDRGIRVTNGRGNFDIPIAEWNIMAMLMCHRNTLGMMENQRSGTWDRSPRFQNELRGAVVGFYGYGGIARETARLGKTMGLTVWALTRDGKAKKRPDTYCLAGTGDPDGLLPDRLFSPEEKGEFLTEVDFLVIAMPLTPATEGIIGEEELKALKSTAVLINPARALLIQEEALMRCLSEGWIRGAAIDVHYAYPLTADHPLWSMPNLILTPHVSGAEASPRFLERVYDIFLQNCRRYADDRKLLNELSDDQLMGK